VPLQALDVSLNVMSLGGLALGVGMLVDNSIVVLEAVARVRADQGVTRDATARRRTAVQGTAEVAASVVASTLTTVAVFLPMAFVEGIAGQLVRDLSLAVSFSILSSMLVSLTLVPVLMSLGGEEAVDPTAAPPRRSVLALLIVPVALLFRLLGLVIAAIGAVLGVLARPFAALWDALERTYPWLLRRALRRPGVIAVLACWCASSPCRSSTATGGRSCPRSRSASSTCSWSCPRAPRCRGPKRSCARSAPCSTTTAPSTSTSRASAA
jgi:multidrug efflux pump subunit AcrB